MLAGAVAVLMLAAKDMSTYGTFASAAKMPDVPVKVNGTLCKDKEIHFQPENNANYFSFFMKDTEGDIKKVVMKQAKPQDFERSEQIVLTGKMQGDDFVASDMLLKCPSKYKDEQTHITAQKNE
jgi:cytochrome c-type biogenesis protein CcmE